MARPSALLVGPGTQPFGDVGLVVAPGPEPGRLDLGRRRPEQDQGGVGPVPADLAGTLEVDLQEHIVPGRGLGYGVP